MLIGAATFEPDSAREVIERGKQTALSIGHGGNNTAMHLSAQLFSDMAGIKPTLVPYRGSQPVASDVLAGHIPLGVTDIPSAISLIKAGQMKAHRRVDRAAHHVAAERADHRGVRAAGIRGGRLVRRGRAGRHAG